jgi:hypothetical protein
MITVARSRSKGPKGKATPAKSPPKKGKGKAAAEPKPAAPTRRSPRQTVHPVLTDPNADEALDDLVHETYDATAAWLAAGATMKAQRTKLADRMRGLKNDDGSPLGVYKTHDGYLVKLTTSKEKLSIKRTDDAREIDLDTDPDDGED